MGHVHTCRTESSSEQSEEIITVATFALRCSWCFGFTEQPFWICYTDLCINRQKLKVREHSAMQPGPMAMRERDEQVWVLLLGKAWQPLEQQVVCKLLCVSHSMTQLVHATCVGRLPAVMELSWESRCKRTVLRPAAVPLAATLSLPQGVTPAPGPVHLLGELPPPPLAPAALSPAPAAALSLPQGLGGAPAAAQLLHGVPLPPAPAAAFNLPQGFPDAPGAAHLQHGLPLLPAPAAAGLPPATAVNLPQGQFSGVQGAAGMLLPLQVVAAPVTDTQQQQHDQGGAVPARSDQGWVGQAASGAGFPPSGTLHAAPGWTGSKETIMALLRQGLPPMAAVAAASRLPGQVPGAGPSAAAAAAAAAGAPGALGMQGKQQLLPSLQAAVGCVGPTQPYAGALHNLKQRQQQQPHVLETDAPSRWVVKHAVLLSSLTVNLHDTDEGRLSEAVQTAVAALTDGSGNSAAAPAGAAAAATSMPHAAAATAPAAAAAAAAAAADREAGGLLLQELKLPCPSDGSLLCALAGSRQLTRLDFALTASAAASAQLQAAVGSFTGLQELSFHELWQSRPPDSAHSMDGAYGGLQRQGGYVEPLTAFEQVAHVLQPLARLTRLDYNRMLYKQDTLQQLPPSLVALRLADGGWGRGKRSKADSEPTLRSRCDDPVLVRKAGVSFSHLTALTQLVVDNIQEPDELPGSLVALSIGSCLSLMPAQALLRLQRLKLSDILAGAEFELLQKLPSLQEVHVVAQAPQLIYGEPSETDVALMAAAPHFGSIPLKSLKLGSVTIRDRLCDALGKCSALTRLSFEFVRFIAPLALGRLAAALQNMKLLRDFEVVEVEFELEDGEATTPAVTDYRALLNGLAALPDLRSVRFSECWGIGEAAAELAAATKLECLTLYVCGVPSQTEALLRTKFPHLDEDSLLIES